MATSMNYSVVARKNPSKKSEPAKYYALAQASGELDFDEMCEAITGRTTCTETDVRAALAGIIYEAKRALKAGRIVRLGDLGSMQMGLSSTGAEKAEDFTLSMIKKSRINFRPGKGLTDITKTMAYTRVVTRSMQSSESGGSADGGIEENPLG
ncbi:HU family DNA-binding protein [Bacteroides cellulosilyticus]|uniref:HU family DNA-binding protein n=1 Tax=Bacteroides cellulosilyticus TaxID=246787 RepID=UPI000E4D8012|nr:HU family DNA-binding protein [Bacteroides cellulosilyticus]RGU29894.1 DNA-binding protein [Bacteroides cellulosilyticus]